MTTYEPFDHEFLADPYPTYRRMRDEAPVARNERLGIYALSRFDDVWSAVHDTDTFSSASGISLMTSPVRPAKMYQRSSSW